MFQSTDKGFRVTFENGFSLSVQWGPFNYCSNRDLPLGAMVPPSKTAEVAVIHEESGKFVPFWGRNQDQVKGYVTADEVAALMNQVAMMTQFKEETDNAGNYGRQILQN